MPFEVHKHKKFVESLPRHHASTDDVQRWILGWLVAHMDALDILHLRMEPRVKLLPWDGRTIQDASRKELALRLKWIFTYDQTSLKPESKEDKMFDLLVEEIQIAQAWKAKKAAEKSAPERHPLFSMGLLASSVYLLARLGYTCTLEYGGQKNALDEAIVTLGETNIA